VKIPATDWIYDIETFLDIFAACFVHAQTKQRYVFEVSDRRDQSREFVQFIHQLRTWNARLVGYNNEGFDWPVVQSLVERAAMVGSFTHHDARAKSTAIIGAQNGNDRWSHTIWPRDRLVAQVDLLKIHHFDNPQKATRLKQLEARMRSKTVEDLPWPHDQPTTDAQKDDVIAYMCKDVSDTLKFYVASLEMIAFRDELATKYPKLQDPVNMNDTKIGKEFFTMELERQGVPCFDRDANGRRTKRQTWRNSIAIRDVVSPKVHFRNAEFQRVRDWLEAQVLNRQQIEDALSDTVETKGVFKGVTATVRGFEFVFGTGGIHGSVKKQVIRSDDEYEVWDWDVESFYPNLAITNRFYPAHLSEAFCDIYQQVFEMRKSHPKGTVENAMLKLALNGVYGDSNNRYSVFYDPQYTMSITLNGQFMLCMLAEWLIDHDWPGGKPMVEMIQANTDGLTVRVHKSHVAWMHEVCEAWQKHTGLKLESAQYDAMHVRDVNNYLAVGKGGKKIKRIGDYAYQTWFDDHATRERGWHKDHSMLVVPKAAEAQMVHGIPVEDFIMRHRDPHDFQLLIKVTGASKLMHGDRLVQNVTRYYVSTNGDYLTKIMPPAKGKEADREFAVQSGWRVTITNDMDQFDWRTVNWLYYIQKARELVI